MHVRVGEGGNVCVDSVKDWVREGGYRILWVRCLAEEEEVEHEPAMLSGGH